MVFSLVVSITLLVLGAIAAANLIGRVSPSAKEQLEKLESVRGVLGLVGLILGVVLLVRGLMVGEVPPV